MPLLGFGLLQSQPQIFQTIAYQGVASLADNTSPPGVASVTLQVIGTGLIDFLRTALPNQIGVASWAQNTNPAFDSADYDFRLDITSGALSGGPHSGTGIWIAGAGLGVQASWGVEETGAGVQSVNGNFRVRPTGGGADLFLQAISLTAESTP